MLIIDSYDKKRIMQHGFSDWADTMIVNTLLQRPYLERLVLDLTPVYACNEALPG